MGFAFWDVGDHFEVGEFIQRRSLPFRGRAPRPKPTIISFSRKFWGRGIFDFFNTIGQKRKLNPCIGNIRFSQKLTLVVLSRYAILLLRTVHHNPQRLIRQRPL